MKRLKGKKIVITGASSGIGRAAASLAAMSGAQLALVARRQDTLESHVRGIFDLGGTASSYAADLMDPKKARQTAQQILRDFDAVDLLINCAGSGIWRFLDETGDEDLSKAMSSPFVSAAHMTRGLLPSMLARQEGTIVNVTSVASYFCWPGATYYTAARWAMRGLHEALTADLAHTSIKTSLAVFAKVDTDYWSNNPKSEERIPKAQKMIRTLRAKDAAQALLAGASRGRRTIVAPLSLRLILAQSKIFPWVTPWLMRRTGYRRPCLTF